MEIMITKPVLFPLPACDSVSPSTPFPLYTHAQMASSLKSLSSLFQPHQANYIPLFLMLFSKPGIWYFLLLSADIVSATGPGWGANIMACSESIIPAWLHCILYCPCPVFALRQRNHQLRCVPRLVQCQRTIGFNKCILDQRRSEQV